MAVKTIRDIDVSGKKVFLRVDFNVPMSNGVITDDNRIIQAIPTIKYLLDNNAKLILASHLGRPKGGFDSKYSLKPCADRLQELLGNEVVVKMSKDVVGKDSQKLAKSLKTNEILLLENVRYHEEEENNDEEFSKQLASLADVYVNDAFGTAHRQHASTYGVATLLPNAIGFLIEKELDMITHNIENPQRPFVAILGGAKVSDKLKIVESLIAKVDTLIIAGAMSYTFLKAQGYEMGNSLVEDDMIEKAKEYLQLAKDKGVEILLPLDHTVAQSIDEEKVSFVTKDQNIPADLMGVDIGKKSIKLFSKAIKQAKLVIWNGPVGVFENKHFAQGTHKLIKALAKSKATSIIGGGDTASAVINMGYENKMTHVSTGGGASLKLFEGKTLAALKAINEKIIY